MFLGCSDVDFHIPLERVARVRQGPEALGGDVTENIYPGMDHTIVQDELEHAKAILNSI